MKTEELLDKYFEGQTSCEEERLLRRFFTQEDVPQHLQPYRALFAYTTREAEKHGRQTRKTARLRSMIRWTARAAACLLLALGIGQVVNTAAPAPESYVVINGVRHTDPALVEEKAREAMQNVSISPEELQGLMFPDMD